VSRPVVVPFRPRFRRRDEINRHLAAWESAGDARGDWASRARGVLEGLGPVFGAFAAYIGSRIDLLPAMDCRELARADRTGRAASPDVVQSLLSADLASMGANLAVDPVPVVVAAVTQVHRAFMPDGTVVHVHVHTTSFQESSEDLEALALAEPVFTGRIASPALVSAVADFRARFHQEADLMARAALLEDGAREMRRGAPLLLPRAFPALCSPRILVTEIPEDEESAALAGEDPRASESPGKAAVQAWLRQALFASVCPIFAPDERMAMAGDRLIASSVMSIPTRTQQRLLSYLFAVAGESPDRAWAALRADLVAAPDAAPAEHVEREFRRLVPFRDDRSTDTGSMVANHVFLQWRSASRHGWLPAPPVVPFYRGLFGALSAAPHSDADGDVLADAISSLRVQSDVRQLGTWMADSDVMSAVERQMALLIELPQKLDRLLTVAADGAVRVQLVTDDPSASQRDRAATAVALVLLAAALIVLAGALPAVRQLWASEPWRSAVLVITGAVLVWTVGRLR
jgi:hypothetical protein